MTKWRRELLSDLYKTALMAKQLKKKDIQCSSSAITKPCKMAQAITPSRPRRNQDPQGLAG